MTNFRFLFALFCCITYFFSNAGSSQQPPPLKHILSCRGDQLYEGDQPFRFVSFNIPNLHLVEDGFSFSAPTPWRWPDEFEIADALESVRQMGGTVVRTYVLAVRREGSDMGEHVHVKGPGQFNEQAFVALDKVLQIANEKGVRVIIPLVDNWHWWGGIKEYAGFRNKPKSAFWTDRQIISDFEATIRFTLSRVNTLTGVAYKDDPAIFGWETGNELDSTPQWTKRIAATIKSIDPNHLVIDGYALHGVRTSSLNDPNIDVITTHHYPNTDAEFVPAIIKAHQATVGKKPFFIGEFGFVPIQKIKEVLDVVLQRNISGAMLWSLRPHRREGGFYWHDEPSGQYKFKAYHWPGFASGDAYDEIAMLELTRKSAYQIRGLKLPPIEPPAPPTMLPIQHPGLISWQGSAGASGYDVYRSTNETGPWKIVGQNVSDAAVQYRPLFSDTRAKQNQAYFYRVTARNAGGVSAASNAMGPVVVDHLMLVDEMANHALVHAHVGTVEQLTSSPRRTQEDIHRQQLGIDGQLIYRTASPIQNIRVYTFSNTAHPSLKIEGAHDGKNFQTIPTKVTTVEKSVGDYDYLHPVLIENVSIENDLRFLRLSRYIEQQNGHADPKAHQCQIARIEIEYGGQKSGGQKSQQ